MKKNHYLCTDNKLRLGFYMEPPSSILTDSKSKADPRSDDPLSRSMLDNKSLVVPNHCGDGLFVML